MSDFDAVLERLLSESSFAASLAADPSAALAGYHLSPDEIALLSSQVTADAGGQHTVESRTSQASMFGLLAPLTGVAGFGAADRAGFGEAPATTGFGEAPAGGQGGWAGPATSAVAAQSGFGAAPDAQGTLLDQGFGAAPGVEPAVPSGDGVGAIGSALGGDLSGTVGEQMQTPPPQAVPPPTDYRTRVDVDGDGDWDKHWYAQRADGGVDILADMNRDGRADFVGHDFDRDGLVDAADYDKNRDGRFETHTFDDDGDGWLDRKIISPEK